MLGDWNTKVGSQEIPGVTDKFGLGEQNEAGQRQIEFCQENTLVIANTLSQQYKRRLYTSTLPDGQYQIRLIIFLEAKDGETLYSQQKQNWDLTVAHTTPKRQQMTTAGEDAEKRKPSRTADGNIH